MTYPGYLATAQQMAVLFIASSGLCLILQQRALALRLFAVGCVMATLAGAAASGDSLVRMLVFAAAAVGVCAAILGVHRWPIYWIALAGTLALLLPLLEPILRALAPFWWLLPLLAAIALATALIVRLFLQKIRKGFYGAYSPHAFNRLLARLLDRLTGVRTHRRHHDRHIGEFGTTRRSRSGPGPHTI